MDIKKDLGEELESLIRIKKTKSVLIMFSIYFFWMVLDTVFWVSAYPTQYVQFIGSNVVRLFLGFMICYLLFLIQIKLIKRYSEKAFQLVIYIIIAALVLSIIDSTLALIDMNIWAATAEWKFGIKVILMQAIYSFVTLIGTTGVFYVIYYRTIIIKQNLQIAEANALAKDAQLLMLRYQINPHFLFNSLNAVQSMIEKDKGRAKEMLGDLSDFFRYTLSKNDRMMVTIKEEKDAIERYLAIQKDRFGKRLETKVEIDSNTLDIKIPFFLIHPLVENAIKYGFTSNSEVLQLTIKTTLKEKKLTIVICNNGILESNNKYEVNCNGSTKTGLENIRKRLALFYPDKHEFSLTEKEGFVYSTIIIKNIESNESADNRR